MNGVSGPPARPGGGALRPRGPAGEPEPQAALRTWLAPARVSPDWSLIRTSHQPPLGSLGPTWVEAQLFSYHLTKAPLWVVLRMVMVLNHGEFQVYTSRELNEPPEARPLLQ